ncbi:8-oxo-dGTP diphosphatase [Peribacillus deserti]|uniref:8-oxo-dGTP diphosphatase n=1 Tax=Peribacillus deserti TaxID=673318 RepID=A0ABS2QKY7_9BACI|nr:NUDIX hydrolase [Peribacillus deserti]MBM7693841.1 8-oxo-dGTP diphosphatase [Peribacillus deserti]
MEKDNPKHIVGVSGLVTNDNGEVLVVQSIDRLDTWELPGGQVQEGEPLDQAVIRECLEETGILIKPVGITGVYYNSSYDVLSVVFRCEYISGEINIQPDEIKDAKFAEITEANMDQYFTRPHIKSRFIDALGPEVMVPYETWDDPYNRTVRLEPSLTSPHPECKN